MFAESCLLLEMVSCIVLVSRIIPVSKKGICVVEESLRNCKMEISLSCYLTVKSLNPLELSLRILLTKRLHRER